MGEMDELHDPRSTPPSPSAASSPAEQPAEPRTPQSSRLPSRRPLAKRPGVARVTRESLADASQLEPALCPQLQQFWDDAMADSQRQAQRYTALAQFWDYLDDDDDDGYTAEIIGVARALRWTTSFADKQVRDAHHALARLPQNFARLEAGEFPLEWFQRLIRRTRHLSARNLARVDESVAQWPMNLTVEQFRRRLSSLITRVEADSEIPEHLTPEGRRRVEMLPPGEDGMGCLRIVGPAPEILSLARRLDMAAHAVQAAQRHALEKGQAPPLDRDGSVADTGMPSSLGRLQYDLLMGADLDTDRARVPAERFRVSVTVPMLTLLGASAEPGMLEGTIPLPATMARELAGEVETWHRILTDPASGEFQPLAADRYRPTPSMLEHLRLRNATCAVPGCNRPSSWASEADHIQEYDHADPTRGGLTEIENLHLLCWQHHRLKTAGLIDPQRLPKKPGLAGETLWTIHGRMRTLVRDDTDLATPATVREFTAAWERFERFRQSRRGPDSPEPPDSPDPPDPPY